MVCAVEKIEKSTLFWGEGGKCDQDAQKFNFITKCVNTFVAHCRSSGLSLIYSSMSLDSGYFKRTNGCSQWFLSRLAKKKPTARRVWSQLEHSRTLILTILGRTDLKENYLCFSFQVLEYYRQQAEDLCSSLSII